MTLKYYPKFLGKELSISDDDLCATCKHLCYRPGDSSVCDLGFPAGFDDDNYAQKCEDYADHEPS